MTARTVPGMARAHPPGGLHGLKAQIKLTRPAINQLRVVISRADVLDVPRSRRDECTIYTAVAPDLIFAVRACGDMAPLHGPQIAEVERSGFS